MINREVIYERNLTGSYMKIPASYDAAFDEKMMLRKKLAGLLPVEKCYVDGSGQYWYNISGRQSLDTFCKVKTLGIDFIERMIVSICSQIEILEWNLLNADSLLLDPEFIFITNSNQEIIFTIYPGAKESISKEFQQLMEFLLTKIDHKDAQAVQMAYSIYEKTLDEGYNLMDIRNSILENKNSAAKEAEAFQKKSHPVREIEAPPKKSVTVKNKPETVLPLPNGEDKTIEKRSAEKADLPNKRKSTASMWEKTKKIILGEGQQEDELQEMEDPYKKMKNIWKEWRDHLEIKRKERKIEVVYPAERYEEESIAQANYTKRPAPTVNPTICLSDYREHPEGLLLYEGLENLDNIRLGKEDARIGQGEDVDIIIAKNTISHFHAQLEYKDNEYFLEDLNSTNGTFVNDTPLAYKEKRKLCCNDIIRFADVKYRFI